MPKTTKISQHAGTYRLHEPKHEHFVSLTQHTVTTHLPPELAEGVVGPNQEDSMTTSTASTRNHNLGWLLLVAAAAALSFAVAYTIWGQNPNAPSADKPAVHQSSAAPTEDLTRGVDKTEIAGAAYTSLGAVPKVGPQVKNWKLTNTVGKDCPDGTPAVDKGKTMTNVGGQEFENHRWYCSPKHDHPHS
jgi:hypothetical protein